MQMQRRSRAIGWVLGCKTVRIYAQAVKQKVWSEITGVWGSSLRACETLKLRQTDFEEKNTDCFSV